MAELRIGTCSWKYPSWAGLVYSSREPANYLAEYAARYDSVEVDQWFWSLGKRGAALPRRETVAEYDAATPPGFRFTVKCPDALTLSHFRGGKGAALEPNGRFLDPELFLRFLDATAALVPKIGLYIFQFEYMNKDKMPSRADFEGRLAAFLDGLPRDLPYAVEIRNPRWIDGAWFELLRGLRAAPVILQGYWMDDAAATLGRHRDAMGDTMCLRLHGEDREGMEERSGEDWSRIVRPKDAELDALAGTIKYQYERGARVFVNVNNHYEGSAPLTIERLRERLG